jgi:potassium-dependent mechanosensitive channel
MGAAARRALCLSLLVLNVLVGAGDAADEPRTPQRETPSPAAIPVAEVATRAAEVASLLREITTRLAPSPEIDTIEKNLPGLHKLIDLELAAAKSILQGQPSLDMLQAQQQLWQQRQVQTTAWLTALTQRATRIEEALGRLAGLRKTWLETREAAFAAPAPTPILGQIETALASIDATEKLLVAQRTAVLDLQSVVAQEVGRSGTALAEFTQAQQHAVGGILAREGPPLWSAWVWNDVRSSFPVRIRQIGAGYWADLDRYAREPRGMPLHVGMFAALALLLMEARRRIRRFSPGLEGPSAATAVFDRPYAATVIVALLTVASPYLLVPPTIRNLLVVLGLAAAIRLTQPTIDQRIVPELYALWALFALDSFRGVLAGVPAVEQALLIVEALAGLAVLGYSMSRGGLRASTAPAETESLPGLRFAAGLVMVGFALTLIAAGTGYLRLARLLASGILGSGALALMLHAGVRVLTGLVAFALRIWPLRLLHFVRDHRDLLERRIRRARWSGRRPSGGWSARWTTSGCCNRPSPPPEPC